MKIDFQCFNFFIGGAQGIEEEVQAVLDKDTEPFVSNLWRMIVFYQLKIQDGK